MLHFLLFQTQLSVRPGPRIDFVIFIQNLQKQFHWITHSSVILKLITLLQTKLILLNESGRKYLLGSGKQGADIWFKKYSRRYLSQITNDASCVPFYLLLILCLILSRRQTYCVRSTIYVQRRHKPYQQKLLMMIIMMMTREES